MQRAILASAIIGVVVVIWLVRDSRTQTRSFDIPRPAWDARGEEARQDVFPEVLSILAVDGLPRLMKRAEFVDAFKRWEPRLRKREGSYAGPKLEGDLFDYYSVILRKEEGNRPKSVGPWRNWLLVVSIHRPSDTVGEWWITTEP